MEDGIMSLHEYCSYCGDSIESKEDCIWYDGEPFCQKSCAEQFKEENKYIKFINGKHFFIHAKNRTITAIL